MRTSRRPAVIAALASLARFGRPHQEEAAERRGQLTRCAGSQEEAGTCPPAEAVHVPNRRKCPQRPSRRRPQCKEASRPRENRSGCGHMRAVYSIRVQTTSRVHGPGRRSVVPMTDMHRAVTCVCVDVAWHVWTCMVDGSFKSLSRCVAVACRRERGPAPGRWGRRSGTGGGVLTHKRLTVRFEPQPGFVARGGACGHAPRKGINGLYVGGVGDCFGSLGPCPSGGAHSSRTSFRVGFHCALRC